MLESFLPFIVAEQEICSEICKLENVIEAAETADDIQIKTKLMEEKTQALYFIQEMGWLLHRSRVKVRLGPVAPVQDNFHFNRFMWLVGFSMDHDWCAVMKKLLNIVFEGTDLHDIMTCCLRRARGDTTDGSLRPCQRHRID